MTVLDKFAVKIGDHPSGPFTGAYYYSPADDCVWYSAGGHPRNCGKLEFFDPSSWRIALNDKGKRMLTVQA